MATSYYEDVAVGVVHDLGTTTIEAEEMVAFAECYDPQPIHTDPETAAETMYGGLIASGWYTAARCMRQFADEYLVDVASLGAFGVEQLTWARPARAGDELAVTLEILDKRVSESYPDRGYVTTKLRGVDADDELVIAWEATNIFERRGD